MLMKKENNKRLLVLNKNIINCNICKRLKDFRTKVATEKRKMYANEIYWGKPITGFGDINGKIMIIGLAPAAHGGNRTGRVFTGDKSSDFLFECLGKVGLANQSFSIHKNDGLKLINTYLTLSLKCVPPGDKPTKEELLNCSKYLNEEFLILEKYQSNCCIRKNSFRQYNFFL